MVVNLAKCIDHIVLIEDKIKGKVKLSSNKVIQSYFESLYIVICFIDITLAK